MRFISVTYAKGKVMSVYFVHKMSDGGIGTPANWGTVQSPPAHQRLAAALNRGGPRHNYVKAPPTRKTGSHRLASSTVSDNQRILECADQVAEQEHNLLSPSVEDT